FLRGHGPMISLFDEMVRLFAVLNPPLNGPRGRILQFVSAQRGEGVSTIAREFARVVSLHSPEDVLLLDLNTETEGQYEFFKNVEERERSLSVGDALDLGFDPGALWRLVSEADLQDRVTLPRGPLMTFHRIGSTR